MNKLKFTNDEGTAFYKELNKNIDTWFKEQGIAKTGNNTMFFKIILYFGLDILFYNLMMNSTSVQTFYLYYLLMGLSVLLTAFNISHDASHGVAVKSRFWNRMLFTISFNLQGNNAYVWGKNHTESHHLYTNIEGSDIDVLNNPLIRMTENQPLKWFHRYQVYYAPLLSLLYSINWFFMRETLMLFNYTSRTIKIRIPPFEVFKLVVFKLAYLGYMIVLPILLLPFGWANVILVFILNHFMVSIIFTSVLGVSHLSDFVTHPVADKDGRLPMSWPMLQMCTSVDYNAESVFLNGVLGGFNAHAMHHILPNICHVHYIRLLPIFKATAAKHNVTYMNMPYSKALMAYYRFLYKMGHGEKIQIESYESQTS